MDFLILLSCLSKIPSWKLQCWDILQRIPLLLISCLSGSGELWNLQSRTNTKHFPLAVHSQAFVSLLISSCYFAENEILYESYSGPVHKRMNHVLKDVSEYDSALSWFESLNLPFVNAKLFQIRLLKREKKGVLDCDPHRKPDSRTFECKALSERDLCVCILEMRAEAMHGSISADCTVGTKYYLAVRRSCSWLGRRLQCMWTHVVEITIPITFWIAIRNVFRKRDSSPCEHCHWYSILEIFVSCGFLVCQEVEMKVTILNICQKLFGC